MAFSIEMHEFFVEGKNREKSHVLLHIAEPGSPEEIDKGYLFALVEIRFGTIELIEHLQQLITDIESGYYETAETEEKSAFEATMEFVNRRAALFMAASHSTFDCLVGVLQDKTLSLAYYGAPLASLFYQGKQGLTSMSIIQKDEEEMTEQIFSSIVQGEISPHDFVFLSTSGINEYFSSDRLQKIIASRTTRQTAEHIQKVLEDLDSEHSFGGILFRLLPESEAPKTGKQPLNSKQGSAASLNRFIAAQKHTAEILSPPIIDQFTKQLRAKLNELGSKKETESVYKKRHTVAETNFRPRDSKAKLSWFNLILIYLGRGLVSLAIFIFRNLKMILRSLGQGLLMLFILITNKNNGRQEMMKTFRDTIEQKKRQLSALPLTSKFLLLLTVISGLLFMGSLSYFKIKEGIEAKRQAYTSILQAAQDKKDAADAGLVYGDTTKAFALLQEAKTILGTFTPKKKDQEKEKQLENSIEESLRKLRKIVLVEPIVVADFSKSESESKAKRIASIGDWLVIYGEDDNKLYRINRLTKAVENKEFDASFHPLSDTTPKEQDNLLLLGKNNQISEYNKDSGHLSTRAITFPGTDANIVDIFIYNNKLYTLDQKQQQLYKHAKTQTGFDKGTPWLSNSQADLTSAVALAIDGDVFVLTSDNLLKFLAGKLESFAISGLDPALINPTDLFTYNDVNNIYILEPTNQRVIVLSKAGELIQQYTATNWKKPTGMVVDEKNKMIFILDSNIVYSFGI